MLMEQIAHPAVSTPAQFGMKRAQTTSIEASVKPTV